MSQPKILLLDIETCPGEAYIWNIWDNFIPIERIKSPPRIICWGAKWLGKAEMFYADERDGVISMFSQIHALMSTADAVVTYNGDRFDIPRLRGAFVEHGFDPLPPFASIDLLKSVKKLGLISSKLAYIAPFFEIGEKVKTEGFSLWRDCMAGDPAAWGRMRKYNEQDVRLLGRLYGILKPHITNHPRLFPKSGTRPVCKFCNSTHVQFRGTYFTKELQYDRFQCQGCRSWDKVRKESGTNNKKSPAND